VITWLWAHVRGYGLAVYILYVMNLMAGAYSQDCLSVLTFTAFIAILGLCLLQETHYPRNCERLNVYFPILETSIFVAYLIHYSLLSLYQNMSCYTSRSIFTVQFLYCPEFHCTSGFKITHLIVFIRFHCTSVHVSWIGIAR